jgi:FKBP-type peptidyl-prolyl cis-trans isomerase FkpA
MKKGLLLFIGISTLIISCKKNKDCTSSAPTTVASATEITNIQSFLSTNGITNAIQHPNGLFYVINPQGAGESPNLCSNVTISYKGNVFGNPKAFDSTSDGGATRSFVLNGLIAGWQLGLPLVKSGGSVTLYIPPSLGYGSQANNGAIPPNSYLKFTINLVSVTN